MFLLVASLTLFTGTVHAQRALPRMRSIELRGGMVDGFCTAASKDAGYYFGIAMSRYAKHADKWVFGIEYLSRYYPYKAGRIPMAQFTAEGGYYYKFFADPSHTFLFYIGGSAMTGYETVNWGDKRLYDGATIRNRDRFLYGGAVTLEVDAYLTDRIILSLSGRERCLWGTTTGHFHTQYGIGVKFIIN
nr:conjugal transfer protein TraO [uncultured Alistipes sp.]